MPLLTTGIPQGSRIIEGLTLANNGSGAIDIATGICSDWTYTRLINLSTGLTAKSISSTFTVGVSGGLLDEGTVGNNTYHIYLIERPDTEVIDAVGSLSNNNSGTVTISNASPAVVTWSDHGLQVGAGVTFSTTGSLPTGITAGTRYYVISSGFGTGSFQISASIGGGAVNTSSAGSGIHSAFAQPKLPTSYTYYRRIGSIIRSGGSILSFTQYGDKFLLSSIVNDVNNVSPTTTATNYKLTIPIGINANVIINAALKNNGTAYLRVYSPTQTDVTVTLNNANLNVGNTTAPTNEAVQLQILTNKSAQIRTRADSSTSGFYVSTDGWDDYRGKI